jgi:hypothetical protein
LKQKSVTRTKEQLWNDILPQADLGSIADDIAKVLNQSIGKSPRNVTAANLVAANLKRKYLVSDAKLGMLCRLIDLYPEDLTAFLDQIDFKEFRRIAEYVSKLPIVKAGRAQPQNDAQRAENLKRAKNRYERRRRRFRAGSIEQEFGRRPSVLLPGMNLIASCLDPLFRGGSIKMSGATDSLENLFGVDRHWFPKALPYERIGRSVFYNLAAVVACMTHLLDNLDPRQPWLPNRHTRKQVLEGIIRRAGEFSPDLSDLLAQRLQAYI